MPRLQWFQYALNVSIMYERFYAFLCQQKTYYFNPIICGIVSDS